MMNPMHDDPDVAPVSWGERLAALAGILTAALILAICADMVSGGRLAAAARLGGKTPDGKTPGNDCGC